MEPDEFAIAPAYDAFPFAGAAMPGPEVAQAQTVAPVEAPAVRADADSIAALEAELGAIESELHALDHDAH